MSPGELGSPFFGLRTMKQQFSGFQIRVVALCFILNMLDGADVLVVSYSAPLLIDEWGLSASLLGWIFSAGLAGMTLGALLIAPFADVYGRKPVILLALAIIASGMLLSTLVGSVAQLIGLRLFVGLGIGAMLASIPALSSEYAPARYKALAVALTTAGYPLGAAVTGFLSVVVLPEWGWRGLFALAGVASAIMLPICMLFLPESLSFLRVSRSPTAQQRRRVLLEKAGLEDEEAQPPPQTKTSILTIFQAGYGRQTAMLATAFFCAFITLYFLTSWIPKISVQVGLAMEQAIYAGTAFNAGAFLGLLLLGWVASKRSLEGLLATFLLSAVGAMMAFAWFHHSILWVLIEIFVLGVFMQGGFGGLYALVTKYYPTEVRASGAGFCLGVGRLGAVFGPMLGGYLMSFQVSIESLFVIFSIPLALAAMLVIILARANLREA